MNGSAYVVGYTLSTDFPAANAYQGSNAGGADAFVTKLSPSGSTLVYSTYLGGSNWELGYGVAVDASGSAYVTGRTTSANFPTASAYQNSSGGLDDAFVTKLSASGSSLDYSTYLGGSSLDYGYGIAVDASGSAYIAGQTYSTDFPTANPYHGSNAGSADAVFTKLSPSGNSLVYSTYFGGSAYDYAGGIAVDASGSAYVTGYTLSTNFPTANAYQGTNAGGDDSFVAKLVPKLVLSPASTSVAPQGSKAFSASGGTGGYVYSLQTNASGGTINALTGAYTAGPTGNVTDVVQVTDSTNETKTANVTVGPGVSISPASPTVPTAGSVGFTATGGSGTGYAWVLATNNSGGSIDPSTGAYTAGATAKVADTVQVTDSLGNAATATVHVTDAAPADAGTDGAAPADAGADGADGAAPDGSTDLDGGPGVDAGNGDVGNTGGCGCDVVGDTRSEGWLAWAALGALLLVVRRRKTASER